MSENPAKISIIATQAGEKEVLSATAAISYRVGLVQKSGRTAMVLCHRKYSLFLSKIQC